jgi:hypothetical protein
MMERGIPLHWVEAAISGPDWTAPDSDPALIHSFRVIGEAGGRVLKVVHRPEGNDVSS